MKSGEKWPGFIENKRIFSSEADDSTHLPCRLHLLDIPILKRITEQNRFHIEMLDYVGGKTMECQKNFVWMEENGSE